MFCFAFVVVFTFVLFFFGALGVQFACHANMHMKMKGLNEGWWGERGRRERGSVTYLFVYEGVNLLERLAIHVLRKGLKFAGQHIAILDGGLGAGMEAIFAHQLNVAILVLDLRLLRVGNDLLFGHCKNEREREKEGVRVRGGTIYRFFGNAHEIIIIKQCYFYMAKRICHKIYRVENLNYLN